MEVPERYFENNVGRHRAPARRAPRRRRERIVFSSTCAVYGTPAHPARRRGTPRRAREPLRREQADRRADAPLVRRVSRPAARRAPLLQRGRRVGRRPHRRGQPAPAQPGAARDAGRAGPRSRGSRSTAPTTPRPTAPPSATTSTSTTSPTRTCARWTISSRAARPPSSTSGPARGASRHRGDRRRQARERGRLRDHVGTAAVPVTRPRSTPTTGGHASCSAGNRSTTSTTSSQRVAVALHPPRRLRRGRVNEVRRGRLLAAIRGTGHGRAHRARRTDRATSSSSRS